MTEAEGIAHGDNPLADFDLRRIGKAQSRQTGCSDLDHGHVRLRIAPGDLGFELAPVFQPHANPFCFLHDVIVGQNVGPVLQQAVFRREDEPGPLPNQPPSTWLLRLRLRIWRQRKIIAKKTPEKVVTEGPGITKW